MRWAPVLAVVLGGCIDHNVARPSVGSETHWLGDCDATDACPDGAVCRCGICTRACDGADTCAGGVCAGPDDVTVRALCGPVPVGSGSMCVPTCGADADCPDGLTCADGRCVTADGRPRPGVALHTQDVGVSAHPKLDLLLVVDDSGSMCDEQAAISRAFQEHLTDMVERYDYRIAVVSTDLQSPDDQGRFLRRPAVPEPSLNCPDEHGQPLTPDTADCQALVDSGDLPTIVGSDGRAHDAQTLATWVRCLVTLGSTGDGFEKGLEAMRLALSCDGPNAGSFAPCCIDGHYDARCRPDVEPAFLRPDALLAVVFISDEDDCSTPADNPKRSSRVICRYGTEDRNADGIPDGYADQTLCGGRSAADCFAAECGGRSAAQCEHDQCAISRSANANCLWHQDLLTPVRDYADFLVGLKADPQRQIEVFAFVGDRLTGADGRDLAFVEGRPRAACDPSAEAFDPATAPAQCCPDDVCTGEPWPVCEPTARGATFSGERYADLAALVGANGHGPTRPGDPANVSLCVGDLEGEFTRVLSDVPAIERTFCLDAAPACLVRGADGAPAVCSTDAERADPAHLAIAVLVDGQRTDAFTIEPDAACPGGEAVLLRDAPPPGSTVTLESLDAPP
jgi:hypothetical protein